MTELRQDPTSGEWVVVAKERALRPFDLAHLSAPRALLDVANCPFCPGHEEKTPPELLRYPEDAVQPWKVRVVPNRYPFVSPDGAARRARDGSFVSMPGNGHHEVVIESPRHDARPADLTAPELAHVFQAYQRRLKDLRRDPNIKQILIFKNYGEAAGTSIAHLHSQIVALPVVPVVVQRKLDIVRRHRATTGRSLYGDILESERRARTRVIAEAGEFLAFHPFASRFPFETWILPQTPRPSFEGVSEKELLDLAELLNKVLGTFRDRLGDPAFNYIIDGAPIDQVEHTDFTWHIEIVPRLTTAGGFELGVGVYVNPAAPEETAQLMRL